MTPNPYASANETSSLVRKATPDELWLAEQINRINPDHDSQDVHSGYVQALAILVFEQRRECVRLKGEAKVLRDLLKEARSVIETVIEDGREIDGLPELSSAMFAAMRESAGGFQ